MAIAGWMRLRGAIRPWMVAVALAGATGAAGCKSRGERAAPEAGSAAEVPGAVGSTEAGPADGVVDASVAECSPAQIYGPAPACVDDAKCIEEHGAGWVCERGTYDVPDGCGGTIRWPTGACKAGPGAAVDGGLSAADATAADVVEPADGAADLTPAEMAQLVRDAATVARADVDRLPAVTVYGVPPPRESVADYGVPMEASPRGVVTPAGLPQQVGGSGTLDVAVVQRKLRPLQSTVRRCYEDALRGDPGLAGVLQLEAEVSAAGAVTATVATNDDALSAAGVTACVVQLARRVSFADAPPEGGTVRVRFGLRFQPQE
jgi:hypothetical protein